MHATCAARKRVVRAQGVTFNSFSAFESIVDVGLVQHSNVPHRIYLETTKGYCCWTGGIANKHVNLSNLRATSAGRRGSSRVREKRAAGMAPANRNNSRLVGTQNCRQRARYSTRPRVVAVVVGSGCTWTHSPNGLCPFVTPLPPQVISNRFE